MRYIIEADVVYCPCHSIQLQSNTSEIESSKKAAMGNCLGNQRDTDSLLLCGEDGDRQCKSF